MTLGMGEKNYDNTPSPQQRREARVNNVIEGRTERSDFLSELRQEARGAGDEGVVSETLTALAKERARVQRGDRDIVDLDDSPESNDTRRLQRNRMENIEFLATALTQLEAELRSGRNGPQTH